MTTPILLFIVLGLCFGLATMTRQHFFSEGVSRSDADVRGWKQRVVWVLMCSLLWPLMALTGLHSLWLLARRRARAEQAPRE